MQKYLKCAQKPASIQLNQLVGESKMCTVMREAKTTKKTADQDSLCICKSSPTEEDDGTR